MNLYIESSKRHKSYSWKEIPIKLKHKNLEGKNTLKLHYLKDKPSGLEILGYIEMKSLSKVYNSATDKSNEDEKWIVFLERSFSIGYPISNKAAHQVKGYIIVQEDKFNNAKEYAVGITSVSSCLPLMAFLIQYTIPVSVAAISIAAASIAGGVILTNNAKQNNNSNIESTEKPLGVADDLESYNDSEVPISNNTGLPEASEEGIKLNILGDTAVSTGEALPFTNYSTNTVKLNYIVIDATTNKQLYESGLMTPGTSLTKDKGFIPSDYFSKGTHDVIIRIVPYDIETGTKCKGASTPISITIQ